MLCITLSFIVIVVVVPRRLRFLLAIQLKTLKSLLILLLTIKVYCDVLHAILSKSASYDEHTNHHIALGELVVLISVVVDKK